MTTAHQSKRPLGMMALAIGALGIVYGDLGTSPLYSIKETFENKHHRLEVIEPNVLGALSIIFWTLVIIIAIKYVILVLRADNEGEGGILALTALVRPKDHATRTRIPLIVLAGLFGTALLFGDGMITPAISVLSAVEGAELIDPGFESWVVPLSVVILIGLFALQRKGTAVVGKLFAPVMLVWFGTIAVFGAISMARSPEVLQAVNPWHAVDYFQRNGVKAFLSMGSLFLVATGGEALYADMGHFGRRPITLGWFVGVMPPLLLCYFGMGGVLLRDPSAIESPFFLMSPSSVRLPMVVLATLATIIASQALISGVFSLTLQAIKLGYLPRMRVVNTSPDAAGQIYIPIVNWALMAACVGLVLAFQSSVALAAAFGLAVTTTMFATTILFAAFVRANWKWPQWVLWPSAGFVLLIEGAYLGANLFKIPEGGWLPLLVGAVMMTILTTWYTGRRLVYERSRGGHVALNDFCATLGRNGRTTRVPGTAVFLYSHPGAVPTSMLTLLRSTHTLAEEVVIVTVETANTPTVPAARRESIVRHVAGITEVHLRYGFMELTPVAEDLARHAGVDPQRAHFFLGKETVRSTELPGMVRWRERLFALMSRNTADVATWFQLPQDRIIEIGSRVEL
ncbi:MAG: KUP/HAK/KT family potassium transporter [Ilumatobacteraceae bacterium]